MSLLRPLAPLVLEVRERKGKEDPRRRAERLGQASAARPEGTLVWVHAASVGETNAVLPLIEALSAGTSRPQHSADDGHGDVGGSRRAAPAGARLHQYVPLDAPEYAARFLDHWRPDLAIFTESEIWPQPDPRDGRPRAFRWRSSTRGMSQRSFRRWRRNQGMSRPLFARFDFVLAQNEALARRFSDLGAANALAAGNLKIDSPPPPVDPVELERLRAALAGRPAWSRPARTRAKRRSSRRRTGELARSIEGFCTIIAPRHPERGTAIAECLESQGCSVAQRSVGAAAGQSHRTFTSPTPSASWGRFMRSRRWRSSAARWSTTAGRIRSRPCVTGARC